MAHYKDLNKELVEQVQEMRISLQEQREEIISLRATCMQRHESIVFLRKKCKDFAQLHFQQYLELLEPDSSILPFLHGAPSTPVQILGNSGEKANKRKSASLTAECRRSSSLTQTRRSFNSTSPIRSASTAEVEVIESELESSALMLSNAILEEDEDVAQVEVDKTTNSSDSTNTLSEVGTDERESYNNTSVGPNTVEHRTRTFRDITNTLCQTNNSHEATRQDTTEAKTRYKRSSTTMQTKATECRTTGHEPVDPTTVTTTYLSLSVKKPGHVTVIRGRCKSKKQTNEHCSPEGNERHQMRRAELRSSSSADSDDGLLQDSSAKLGQLESIQAVRQMTTREQQQCRESIYTPDEEDAAASYALSDITLSKFKDATSSTPIQRTTVQSSMSLSSPGHCSRPKRSCKPKSMVEPLLNRKMRNESGEKSLCYGIKK